MAPKPLSPAQALWLFCESAGFVIVVDTVFIVVVIFWYDMLVTIWCAVSFQYIVVIPNVLEVSQLWFQFIERCLLVLFLLLQSVVFRRQFFQRRYLSVKRGINHLSIPVIFDLLPMLLIEFHRPAGFPIMK